jgi:hypothetical protein
VPVLSVTVGRRRGLPIAIPRQDGGMTDGGSIVNTLQVKRVDTGEELTVPVIVSRDSVEIGNLAMKRSDLLFALGAEA